ncbi:MAG: hypothetical protein K0R24_1555 [Gammaproteobacteria bacterium]|jgi:intracellular multiplication protein IcmL|nr:hypothetical protein [Gammaproteobacteria bacterium]
MAMESVEGFQVVHLRSDFYCDGFRKILFALGIALLVTFLLIATVIYFLLDKPSPVNFSTDNEWRIVKPVPVDQPYLSTPDLIQWVSRVPTLFNYDFVNYKSELQDNAQYFTENGWKKFLELLNSAIPYATIMNAKLFVNGTAEGAPYVINEGLLAGRYSWWVQTSVNINYSSRYTQSLNLQVLVVRVPTLNNLYGVAIDNIISPDKSTKDKVVTE